MQNLLLKSRAKSTFKKDVLYDRYEWLDELLENIKKISNENSIQNIFMCKKDEYKNYL